MYLLLYYNNAGGSFSQRDPYFLAAGVEVAGHGILWSQPEIVLYDRYNRTKEAGGYPDFIQSPKTGAIYITETQKSIARIHKIDPSLLTALWSQANVSRVPAGHATYFGLGQRSVPAPPVRLGGGLDSHWTRTNDCCDS